MKKKYLKPEVASCEIMNECNLMAGSFGTYSMQPRTMITKYKTNLSDEEMFLEVYSMRGSMYYRDGEGIGSGSLSKEGGSLWDE